MRWLGQAKRCMEIAQDYVENREGFGIKLADRESVQIKLGHIAHQIQIGRLLTMHAAWKLDQGDRARKEVSMAKVHVADTLHNAADVAIQLNGARGFSKDTILEWIYRSARSARVTRRTEVHMMVLARFMRQEGRDFWNWGKGEGQVIRGRLTAAYECAGVGKQGCIECCTCIECCKSGGSHDCPDLFDRRSTRYSS
jgi:acyl-CoA dehydrogenase